MDQQQVRWALLKISLTALAGMTWIFSGFVFESRPEVAGVEAPAPLTPIDSLATLVRLPASLPPRVFAPGPALAGTAAIRMETVKLGCWDLGDASEMATSARWVRLTGRPCQTDSSADSIRIQNLTNGYQGTVFTSQRDLMTSDFIPLQEGANSIQITIDHTEGVRLESRFTVVKSTGE